MFSPGLERFILKLSLDSNTNSGWTRAGERRDQAFSDSSCIQVGALHSVFYLLPAASALKKKHCLLTETQAGVCGIVHGTLLSAVDTLRLDCFPKVLSFFSIRLATSRADDVHDTRRKSALFTQNAVS